MKKRREKLLLIMQPEVKSLDSALRLLSFFNPERQDWSVTELARAVNLHKSQVSRILRTFEMHGFVQRNGRKGVYHLGRIFLLYAGLLRTDELLRRMARPVMERLSKETQGTVFLKVREGAETVTIDRVESTQLLRLTQPIGFRLPLNVTSSGKVFLAYMERKALFDLRREGRFKAFTANTKTEVAKLEVELAEIRRRGFAVSDEEYMLGTWGIAAAIFTGDSTVAATIGLGFPSVLFPSKKIGEVAAPVRRAASEISSRLGWLGRAGFNGKERAAANKTTSAKEKGVQDGRR